MCGPRRVARLDHTRRHQPFTVSGTVSTVTGRPSFDDTMYGVGPPGPDRAGW